MPSFTLELWRVLELNPEDPVTYANIGLSDYPIFQADYREQLNQKIVNHFHNREIGQESYAMWKFNMRRKMSEIMPLYNQLYKSTQLEFDPMATVSMRTVVTGEAETNVEASGNNESTSTGKAGSRAVQSNMPQMMLKGNEDYATGAADSNSTSENTANVEETSKSKSEDKTNNVSEMKGYQGLPSDILMSYRASMINVDMMVIAELEELFMGVWNTGDEYTRTKGYYPYGYLAP